MPITLTPNTQDKAAARRFLDGCYDDSVRRPSQERMERLIALGWVVRVPSGYAETQVLRSIDLY
ncbi:hypothetical protein KZ843_09645 [Pseudomonas aeruginosa]|nr:hypothetical protein [Pseudomonas aeruginosa]MBW6123148.1 hypothetical protein [Pseudomonas aeruginosa]